MPGTLRMLVGDAVLTEPRARAMTHDLVAADRRDFDLEILRGSDHGIGRALEALTQVGLFSGGRTVWLRGFVANAEECQRLAEALESGIPDDAHLVITTEKIDRRMTVFRKLAKAGAIDDLRIAKDKRGRFDEAALSVFVADRIVAAGTKRPSRSTVSLIVERAGGELGEIAQEIDRLCLACDAATGLTEDFIRREMANNAEAWVFDFTEALGTRRLERAERVVARLLDQGEAPLRLTATLATHFAELVEAKRFQRKLPPKALNVPVKAFAAGVYKSLPEAALARFPNPYRAYFAFRAAAAFRAQELRALHGHVLAIDQALKSSSRKPLHLFSRFVQAACATAA